MRTATSVRTFALGLTIAAGSACAMPETIMSTVDGHPSAAVPGQPGREFNFLRTPYKSESGTRWVMRALLDGDNDTNDALLVGQGTSFDLVLSEGDPIPWDATAAALGETCGLFDVAMDINDEGRFVIGNNSKNEAVPGVDEYIAVFDPIEGWIMVAREDDPAPGPGGFTFGCCARGSSITASGEVLFQAQALRLGDDELPDAIMRFDGTSVTREVLTFDTLLTVPQDPFANPTVYINLFIDRNHISGDGASRLVLSETLNNYDVVAINDVAVLAETFDLPNESGLIDSIQSAWLDESGDWFARGDTFSDIDFVVANDTLLAFTGDPITSGSPTSWARRFSVPGSGAFRAHTANSAGDILLAGFTADTTGNGFAVRLNDEIVLRSGEPIDLDNNGLADDNAFMLDMDEDEAFVADNGDVYLVVGVANGAGDSIGEAMVKIAGDAGGCSPVDLAGPLDPTTPDGVLTGADFFRFLDLFSQGDLTIDLAGPLDPTTPDGVLTGADFFRFLDLFSRGC